MAATLPDDILDRLTAGIRELGSTTAWHDWLRVQSRFWHYSANNSLLIAMQCPHATSVAGFRAWLGMKRCVRKGEHGLAILAPIVRKVAGGKPTDPDARIVAGFRATYVFDISQTEGEALPVLPCHRLLGDAPEHQIAALEQVAVAHGYTVTWSPTVALGGANGSTNFLSHVIRVGSDLEPAQQTKTLAHELGHMLSGHGDGSVTRERAELEAESIAWIVCDQLGIDASAYSFGYVAHWMDGTDAAVEGVQESASRISRAAKTILTALENGLENGQVAVEGAA